MRRIFLIFLASLTLAAPLAAETAAAQAPELGAASNFGQGAQPALLQGATGFPVLLFRDGLNWTRAERSPGIYGFDEPRLAYPLALQAAGARLTVTLNWGNPLYDGGDTPQSPAAVAAFAAFAAAVADRFPAVEAIEVGNEFNGANFVKGPLEKAGPEARAAAHVALLTATAQAVRAGHPGLRILGGSTHSIAAGYLWNVLDQGGAGAMDAIALHPYTTPAEQFTRQIAVLRRHPAAAALPVEVTEFGEPDDAAAPGYFLRNYCQFALAGVTRAVWYPLGPRDDGFAPLIDAGGQATAVGQAWRYAAGHFAGQPVADAAPDPFTYGCRFGRDDLVLWGAPRALVPAEGVEVLTPEGLPAQPEAGGGYLLSADRPLILHRSGGIEIGRDAGLAAQAVVADSFDQFAYPEAEEFQAGADGFERFARRGGKEIALVTLPGQERPGVPWTPYRGFAQGADVRLGADSLLPALSGAGAPIEIVHRFTAAEAITVDLTGQVAPSAESEDGITLGVTLNGRTLLETAGKAPAVLALPALQLQAGDRLEIAVGPGATAKGDGSSYRFTLRRP